MVRVSGVSGLGLRGSGSGMRVQGLGITVRFRVHLNLKRPTLLKSYKGVSEN